MHVVIKIILTTPKIKTEINLKLHISTCISPCCIKTVNGELYLVVRPTGHLPCCVCVDNRKH